jgi:hypothetical protein
MLAMPHHPQTPPQMPFPQYGDPHPWRAFIQVLFVLWIVSETLFAYGDWSGQTLVGEWAGGGMPGLLLGAVMWLLFAAQCAIVFCGSRRVLRPLADWAKEIPARKRLVLGAGLLFCVGCLVGLWILLTPFLIIIWLLLGLIALFVMAWANRVAPRYQQPLQNRNGS